MSWLHNMRRMLLATAFCAAIVEPAAVGARASDVYRNARFGYTICYPGNLLIPQRESDNGDGRTFLAKDGAELAVWGEYNNSETLPQHMENSISRVQQDKGTVTYRVAKENWFVISGDLGGKIYYQRTIGSSDRFINFRLTYHRDQAGRYDPVIRQINQCLHE